MDRGSRCRQSIHIVLLIFCVVILERNYVVILKRYYVVILKRYYVVILGRNYVVILGRNYVVILNEVKDPCISLLFLSVLSRHHQKLVNRDVRTYIENVRDTR